MEKKETINISRTFDTETATLIGYEKHFNNINSFIFYVNEFNEYFCVIGDDLITQYSGYDDMKIIIEETILFKSEIICENVNVSKIDYIPYYLKSYNNKKIIEMFELFEINKPTFQSSFNKKDYEINIELNFAAQLRRKHNPSLIDKSSLTYKIYEASLIDKINNTDISKILDNSNQQN